MTLLVYGSYGYTGRLVVERMVADGLTPILGGRDTERLEAQAAELDLQVRPFGLDHEAIVRDRLADVDVLLNCAGPFAATADPLVEACLETGTDYLDITGEVGVFESLAARDAAAERAGITVLPGVGFDVVPTDCLARHLADALPDATRLTLGLQALGELSHGTAATMVEGLDQGFAVREAGRLVGGPDAFRSRDVDFGDGPTPAVSFPWGDLATAYRSTGIGSIEVYFAVPERAISVLSVMARYPNVVGSGPVKALLRTLVDRFVEGPDEAVREQGEARIWGMVENDAGERMEARLRTPEGYRFTAMAAVESVRRALDGRVPEGYQTPATAFGPDYVLTFDGVRREDAAPLSAVGRV